MESYQRESMRRIRRNSLTLLQDLLYKGVQGGGRDTPIPAQPGRDAKMIHSIASLIRGKSKLLLLENPDTVEIYKLNDPTTHSTKASKDDNYLPLIKTKASNLTSIKGALSQSCPYLYDKRRGSFSSIASQRTVEGGPKKQTSLKAQREAKKSNVAVTMTYLGQGRQVSGVGITQDELKVLQQVNGGENICVFKGLVAPGEQFQFISQRHRGFPFSATLFVNGLMVGRISSCCEYRYAPGFQQGRKSCFRLMWQAGGVPCYRCTNLRKKFSSCQQLNIPKMNVALPLETSHVNGTAESCPSSPLFMPAKPKKKSMRKMSYHIREGGESTDSEQEHAVARVKDAFRKRRHRSQTNQGESKGKTAGNNGAVEGEKVNGAKVTQRSATTEQCDDEASPGRAEPKTSRNVTEPQTQQQLNKTSKDQYSLQAEKALTKQTGVKQREHRPNGKNRDGKRRTDIKEESVEKSAALECVPTQHQRSKAKMAELNRQQRNLSSSPRAPGSIELSSESEQQEEEEEKPDKEEELRAQLQAMMTVLSTSDEVEQLVLRNTDLTDDHLLSLAGALKSSPSEVTLLNLNLNLIGPYGAHILLDVLRVKPQVKGLHLFGNKLRDHGILTLMNGIAELQEQTATAAAAIQQAMLLQAEQNMPLPFPIEWSPSAVFILLELDLGGNGLGSEGVKTLASYMRYNSYLEYLGLAQTSAADLTAWKEFFESLKFNYSLTQINLDENNLGDPGVRLLAEMLRENVSLQQVDLDRNGITDVGGNDIMGALLCRAQLPLRHLSLEENNISAGLMSRIQEEVKF